MNQADETTRRAFLCSAGRYVTLGGLLAGAAYLVTAPRASSEPAPACRRKFACAGCALAEDCVLPPAVAARQAQAAPFVKG